jgi:hypothetical protein
MSSTILGIIASSGAAASTNSYESISTVTVGSGGVSNVEFTSIPSTYTHLQIRAISSNSSTGDIYMQYNSDASTGYARHFVYGNGTTVYAGNELTTQSGGYTPTTSGQFGAQIIDILDYKNTNKYKVSRMLTGFDNNGSGFIVFYSGLWPNTAAITSIKLVVFSGTIKQYSSFALYGIKGS